MNFYNYQIPTCNCNGMIGGYKFYCKPDRDGVSAKLEPF